MASVFLFGKATKNKKLLYILLVYIPLVFISGLRNWNVGTDTVAFHQWFEATRYVDIGDFGWFYTLPSTSTDLEWGFIWIGHFLNIFNLDAQIMIFIYSTITVLGMGYAFYKYSKSLWLSTFLYIALYSYAQSFNTAKQWVAIMLMFNAFGYLRDNRKLKFLGMIVVSMIFHFSSIIYALILFLMPINLKKFIYGLVFFTVIGVAGWNLLLNFADVLSIKYLAYAETSYVLESKFGSAILQILGVVILMIISYGLYKKKRFDVKEKETLVICNIFMILFIITLYSRYTIQIIYRFMPYFFVYIYILIPLILDKMARTSIFLKYIIYTTIIIIGFIYCIIMMKLGFEEVIPYSFCF